MKDKEIARIALPRRGIPGEQPENARLRAMLTALLAEVAIIRERMDTIERVATASSAIAPDAIEAYAPDEEASRARDALRRRLIDKVMRPLRDDTELAADRADERLTAADAILEEEEGL